MLQRAEWHGADLLDEIGEVVLATGRAVGSPAWRGADYLEELGRIVLATGSEHLADPAPPAPKGAPGL